MRCNKFNDFPYQHYTNAIEGYFNVLKSRLQKKKGLTYDELVKNVKDVLDEIPINIYKNLIKGAYDRSDKYVKIPSTRKRKPKNIWIKSVFLMFKGVKGINNIYNIYNIYND